MEQLHPQSGGQLHTEPLSRPPSVHLLLVGQPLMTRFPVITGHRGVALSLYKDYGVKKGKNGEEISHSENVVLGPLSHFPHRFLQSPAISK